MSTTATSGWRSATALRRASPSAKPAALAEPRTSDAVVGHTNEEMPFVRGRLHDGVAGVAVLRDVRQELRRAEVADRLDRLGRTRWHIEAEGRRNGASGDERGQGRVEAQVEDGRVDPAGDIAQLDQRLLGLSVGVVDELEGAGRVVRQFGAMLELLLRLPQLHGERGEL